MREQGGRGAWPQQEEVQEPQVGSPRAVLIWPILRQRHQTVAAPAALHGLHRSSTRGLKQGMTGATLHVCSCYCAWLLGDENLDVGIA